VKLYRLYWTLARRYIIVDHNRTFWSLLAEVCCTNRTNLMVERENGDFMVDLNQIALIYLLIASNVCINQVSNWINLAYLFGWWHEEQIHHIKRAHFNWLKFDIVLIYCTNVLLEKVASKPNAFNKKIAILLINR